MFFSASTLHQQPALMFVLNGKALCSLSERSAYAMAEKGWETLPEAVYLLKLSQNMLWPTVTPFLWKTVGNMNIS